MANASRDKNNIPTLLATSNLDGLTIVPLQSNMANHFLKTNDSSDGISLGGNVANRDDNFVPTLIAVSRLDGKTPVVIYADGITGDLLIDSN